MPPPAPPQPPRRDSREAPLVSLAQALVRQRSLDSGIATELIATQSEVAALVAALRRGERTNGNVRTGCARCAAGGASSWARSSAS